MAKNKYSEQLQDAFMLGDMQKVAELKLLIANDAKAKRPQPKKEDLTVFANTILNDDQAPVMKIQKFMVKNYGELWFEDEIGTIDRMLWLDHGTVLDGVNRDKVMALRHVQTSINPYHDWYEFNQVATALGGAGADFLYLTKPTPGMLINALAVLEELKGEEDFGADVLNYISICLYNDGIYTPPPSIAKLVAKNMADLELSSPKHWAAVGAKIDNRDSDETAEGVQASRVIVAEEAAKRYHL